MKVGNKIQKIREIKGFSQESVAAELGISQSAYSKLEKGQIAVTIEKLYAIAKVFEVPVEKLLTFDESNVLHNHQQKGGNAANVILQTPSDKERDLYENRIKHLEEEVAFLRSLLKTGK